jgi:Predicted pyridoxal phosphate-dependent enzyme apparently involved in regulation of cell wall biogenesis
MSNRLAIDGGKPVRDILLPPSYPGAVVYGQEEKDAANEVLDRKSPNRNYGPDLAGKVKEFEKQFSQKIGSKYSLGLTSGTAALVVALKALGIGPGDKVIVPAVTFIATAGAVIIAGAVPVFADVDESMNIDPEEIKKRVDKYTKAVIVVPLLGNPCEMDRIMEEARKYNLLVIEDVAQSSGCKYRGQAAGSYGDVNCFSLQMNKIITTGEGGAVTTNHAGYYERAVRYHDHGMFREKEGFLSMNAEEDIFVGQNYRMSEITGAVALEQLKKQDDIIKSMRKIKSYIKEGIKDIDGLKFRRINDMEGDAGSTVFMSLPDKNIAARFSAALTAENITNGCLYGGKPVYMLPQIYFMKTVDKSGFPFNQFEEKIIYSEGMCPYAEEQLPKNMIIQLSPAFTEKDAEDVVKGIQKVASYLL